MISAAQARESDLHHAMSPFSSLSFFFLGTKNLGICEATKHCNGTSSKTGKRRSIWMGTAFTRCCDVIGRGMQTLNWDAAIESKSKHNRKTRIHDACTLNHPCVWKMLYNKHDLYKLAISLLWPGVCLCCNHWSAGKYSIDKSCINQHQNTTYADHRQDQHMLCFGAGFEAGIWWFFQQGDDFCWNLRIINLVDYINENVHVVLYLTFCQMVRLSETCQGF